MRTQAIRPRRVHDFVSSIFDYDLHAKRVASLANATVGALQGARLAVGVIGRALAVAKDLDPKHAIKQWPLSSLRTEASFSPSSKISSGS
jgi:hypothetical protein